MRIGKSIIFAGLLANSLLLQANPTGYIQLPPVGQRNYEIDSADRFAPAKIGSSEEPNVQNAKIIRDPNFAEIKSNEASGAGLKLPKQHSAVNLAKVPLPKKSVIKFSKLMVRGHLRAPRIKFQLERLPVERSEAAMNSDFSGNVYDLDAGALK